MYLSDYHEQDTIKQWICTPFGIITHLVRSTRAGKVFTGVCDSVQGREGERVSCSGPTQGERGHPDRKSGLWGKKGLP